MFIHVSVAFLCVMHADMAMGVSVLLCVQNLEEDLRCPSLFITPCSLEYHSLYPPLSTVSTVSKLHQSAVSANHEGAHPQLEFDLGAGI